MYRQSPVELYTNLLLAAGLGIIYLAAALGFMGCLGRWNWSLTLLALVAGYLLTTAGSLPGVARLRQPVMPLACVLSGIGIAELLRWCAGRRRGDGGQPDAHRMQQQEVESVALGMGEESPLPHFLTRPAGSEQSPLEATR